MLLVGPWGYVRLFPDDSPPPDPAFRALFADSARIYVIDWGYHTSIVVPRPSHGSFGPPNDPDAPYLEFAWGDRSFYMESDYWPHRLFATVFLPTPSVTYLLGWERPPRREDGMRGLWSRTVSGEELARLFAALDATIRRDSASRRAPAYPAAPGYRGRFYPAYGAYVFWRDCNRWTVDRLHDAGLARASLGVMISAQVSGRLHAFRRE